MDYRNQLKRERSPSIELVCIDDDTDQCSVVFQKSASKKQKVLEPSAVKKLKNEDVGEISKDDEPIKIENEQNKVKLRQRRAKKEITSPDKVKQESETNVALIELFDDDEASLSESLDSESDPDWCVTPPSKKNKLLSKDIQAENSSQVDNTKKLKQPKQKAKADKNIIKKPKSPKGTKRKNDSDEKVVKKRKPTGKKKLKEETEKEKDENVVEIKSNDTCDPIIFSEVQVKDKKNNIPLIESTMVHQGNFNQKVARFWKDENVVAESVNIPPHIVKNVINLLNHDCTVPFIARYRKEMTDDTSAEKLRDIQAAYENVKAVQKKVDTVLKTLNNVENVDQKVIVDLLNAKTLVEVDLLYAPYKPGSKKSLAERSKALGLLPTAQQLLEGKKMLSLIDFSSLVQTDVKGISSQEEVLKGIQHIIADIVSKERSVLDFIRNSRELRYVRITSTKSSTAQKEERKAFVEGKENKNIKYENYFNFDNAAYQVKPHQVMALNRGESQKVLSIKLVVPNNLKSKILDMCHYTFIRCKRLEQETANFVNVCIEDAYNRLLEPHICRQIRSELSKNADKESVNVFSSNLKKLLLTPPVRGKTVLGIDPGFKNGCKLAVVSGTGEVLQVDTIYPHTKSKFQYGGDVSKVKDLVSTYLVEIVAIGNGTACRETETWLSGLINQKVFYPYEIKFCIVNESGASIYSVTPEAQAELPNLDPNLRSAVSIARRLQDPLLEYVKVEPKHLGVGMYQHDIAEAMLKSALDGIVVECVSFVGVDLNVCPEVLLKKISGLTAIRAKRIIEWRELNGSFSNRQQLLQVKGLGPKSYEQCAGFVKILPQTCLNPCSLFMMEKEISNEKGKKKSTKKQTSERNPLDTTVIHPESYDIAEKVLVELDAKPSEVGQQSLIKKVTEYMKVTTVESIAEKFNVPVPQMKLIIDAFLHNIEYDIRAEFEVPLFRTAVQKFEDLVVGQVLTGRVSNVTHFGAFVDIGVGRSGLLHTSKMKRKTVTLGDRISVKVISIDKAKQHIGLEFHIEL